MTTSVERRMGVTGQDFHKEKSMDWTEMYVEMEAFFSDDGEHHVIWYTPKNKEYPVWWCTTHEKEYYKSDCTDYRDTGPGTERRI